MTRRKWTTEAQGEWLAGYLDAFAAASAKKTISAEFFPKMLKEWHRAWPVPEPTLEEIANAKNLEDAVKKKKTKEDSRVKAWFHNHTRGLTCGTGSRGLLKLQSLKPRVRQEWQVYQQLTYETKWKAVIDEEWQSITKKWQEENPGTKMSETRFNFMNVFLQEKYKEESEEVKQDVRRRRAEMKEASEDGKDADMDTKNLAYQKAIDKLPKTLATMGEAIMAQTGWHISFLVGGPEPRQGGKIQTYIMHCGTLDDDRNFEDFLGEDGHKKHMTEPFDDFLNEAFTQCVRDSRCLTLKENTPEDSESDQDVEPKISDVGAKEKQGRKAQKSEYELTREANIAKNVALFREIGEKYPLPDDMKKLKEKVKASKLKGKQRAKETTSLTQGPSNKPTTAVILTGSGDGPGGDGVKVNEKQGTTVPDQTLTLPESDDSSLPPLPIDQPSPPLVSNAPPAPVLAGSLSSDPLTGNAAPSCNVMDVNSPTGAASNVIDVNSPTGAASNVMDVDGSAGAVSLPALTLAAKNQNDQVNLVDKGKLPAWLMSDYLLGISEVTAWQGLVSSFLRFERENTTTGNLPTASRLEEVAAWIKSKKKDVSPDIDADTYGLLRLRRSLLWKAVPPESTSRSSIE